MTVEGWQLAAAGLGIIGVASTAARLYFGGIAKRIDELDLRISAAERFDAAHKQEMSELGRRLDQNARENGSQSAKLDRLGDDVRTLMVTIGRLDERMDISKQMRGILGRRVEDIEQ